MRLPRDADPILYERVVIDHCYECPCIFCQHATALLDDAVRDAGQLLATPVPEGTRHGE